MGVVFKAHQKSLERSVALKLMMGVEQERESEFQRRFFLEAATAAKLKHPNTITVFDYGSDVIDDDRVFYITMELLDGVTLSKVLSKGVPLPPLRAINIAMQMARSLREAHVAGIVHRDLKPGNIMLVRQDADDSEGDADFVKVLDFGLAKTKGGSQTGSQLTKAGTFLGSPRYVAPEQIEGKPIDGRADIYSFGCVLYRMLSGRVPFDGGQAVEVMLKHLHDPVPPLDTPGVPASLDALVMACLAKKAGDRPKTMDDVAAALRRTRQELTGGLSGNLAIPDDINAQLREALTESPPITLTPKEQTSPSQVAPPRATRDDSQPSLAPQPPTAPSSPSMSQTPSSLAALAQSGEWRLGDGGVLGDASRSSFGSSRLQVRPRRGGGALIAGAMIGLVVMGVGVAFRLGHLDDLMAKVQAPRPTAPTTGPVAEADVSARLRIRTDPPGADVFDVTGGVPKLLGLTPLVVPWEVSAGDGSRTLQLKLRGHVPAQARVEPPTPAAAGGPVWLDVEATLRPLPPR
jgi:serine/threonine-protein kinase